MIKEVIKDLSTLEKGDKIKITENTETIFSNTIGNHKQIQNKTLTVTHNNSPYNLRKEEKSWIPGFIWPLIRPGGLQFTVKVTDKNRKKYDIMIKRDRIVTVYSSSNNPTVHGNVEKIKIL